jgi:hypothetical protein
MSVPILFHPTVRLRRGAVLLAFAFALTVAGAEAATLEAVQPYLRTQRGTNGTITLEVALRRLAPTDGAGPELWLAAVTHLGTRDYYAELQRFLEARSLVFYEAVQSPESGPPVRDGSYSLQADLARALGLAFQLDEIDYHPTHFRNSDLSLEQLTRIFAARSESAAAPAPDRPPAEGAVEFEALLQAMTGEGLLGGLARLGVSVLAASSRLQAATKVALIEVLGQLPNDMAGMAGLPAGMQRLLRVLIEERNQAVVRDVRAALDTHPPPASVGVFYGAGHMADLELRLCRALGYRPVEDRWLAAFDVNPRQMGVSELELAWMSRLVRAQLKGFERSEPAPAPTRD